MTKVTIIAVSRLSKIRPYDAAFWSRCAPTALEHLGAGMLDESELPRAELAASEVAGPASLVLGRVSCAPCRASFRPADSHHSSGGKARWLCLSNSATF